jgi:DHA1 family bicyclomycin/chloramphenicol resistance-like MFS transporter
MTTNVSSESLAAPVLTRVQVALALALLLGLQPVTTDLYLPALPQLTRALGASMGAAQQTMAYCCLSSASANILGRRRVGRQPVRCRNCALAAAVAERWPSCNS